MGVKTAVKAAAIGEVIKYIKKDPRNNLLSLIEKGERVLKDDTQLRALARLKEGLTRPGNMWADYIYNILEYTDASIIEKLIEPLRNSVLKSYDIRKASIEKYNCSIPWAILIDITTACNLHCTGCWASEYGKNLQLSYDDLTKIITESKALGTYVYLFTGGEPLMRKKDLVRLAEDNPDCLFSVFTNGTLCDDAFADELKRVGNIFLTMSVEGNEETTDARRGSGTYKAVTAAMARLKERGIPFGASLCHTKYNASVLSSDEYADFLIELGVIFAWIFSFVPVGADSSNELCVTPEQRETMYKQVRKWRFKEGSQKPIMLLDFFNDGEYVGGCVAGGKQYFHISANGDCEPCVFAHYSSVNIKDENSHILDALKSPIFMAYRQRQPFSPNMFRPCPVMDNPGAIKHMVNSTGAHSTDLMSPESAENLFSKTIDIAKEWKETADKMADEYGFIKKRLRTIDLYTEVEKESIHDYKEFE